MVSAELRFLRSMSTLHYTPAAWRAPSARRLETIALAIGLCLPVPAFAATGLSIPLPGVVERLAASLVPWVEELELASGELDAPKGAIVRAAGEAVPASAVAPVTTKANAVAPLGPRATALEEATSAPKPPAAIPTRSGMPGPMPNDRPTASAPAAPGATTAAAPAQPPQPPTRTKESSPVPSPSLQPRTTVPIGSTPAPAPTPKTDPAPTAAPTPVAPVVETVTTVVDNTVTNTVTTVEEVVKDPVATVGKIVEDPVTTVTNTVTGILQPPSQPKKPLLPGLGK
jgi:diguanylate cyclase